MNRIMNLGRWLSLPVVVVLACASPALAAEPPQPIPDGEKRIAEFSTKAVLAALSAQAAQPAPSDNPQVQPGKVKWHANFADACAAAQKSGKPVLLFQMMGKLDEQFC